MSVALEYCCLLVLFAMLISVELSVVVLIDVYLYAGSYIVVGMASNFCVLDHYPTNMLMM